MMKIIQELMAKFYQLIIMVLGALVLILGIGWFCQIWYTNHLANQINTLKKEHADYILQQKIDIANAKAAAATQEKKWSEQIATAESNYNAKIQEITHDASIANANADSLRKQISIANTRLPNASTKTASDYAATLSDVFQECVTEYSELAKQADQDRAIAEKLDEAWPIAASEEKPSK
ncbi:hypothetical protein [Acinetobacter sp. ANC 4639]